MDNRYLEPRNIPVWIIKRKLFSDSYFVWELVLDEMLFFLLHHDLMWSMKDNEISELICWFASNFLRFIATIFAKKTILLK